MSGLDRGTGPLGLVARWLRGAATLGAALLLVACGSLPVITPGAARQPPALIEGKYGPLSPARSQQILAKLKGDNPLANQLDRHLALEQAISDSPITAGNRVRLLKDGPATYRAMLAAIGSARTSINMESYIFEDDEVGRHFADVLIERRASGVQVNLIRDSVGTLGTKPEFFQRLTDAGVRVLEFNPVNPLDAKADWELNQRDHRKLLVVDGRVAFLGGINISSVYSSGSFSRGTGARGVVQPSGQNGWRDTDLQVEGPVVAEFQKLFLETWRKQQGPAIADEPYFPPLPALGSDVVHAIGSSPDDPYSLMYATLLSAIDNAQTEVWLTNAYFVPDPQLRDALKSAVGRGADVRLLLPGTTDSALVFHAGRSFYDELLSAGVKIYERSNVLLHAKTAVIDGVWSTVGSTNLDWRSFLHNQELNAVVLGVEFGNQMRAAFEEDLARSKPVTLEAWRDRPVALRLKESLSRWWQYWL